MSSEVRAAVDAVVRGADADRAATMLLADGWAGVGIAEEAGGSGGSLVDAADVVAAVAAAGLSSWIGDTVFVAGPLLEAAGLALPGDDRPVAVVLDRRGSVGATVSASAVRMPFASEAGHLLVVAPAVGGGTALALVPAASAAIVPGSNLAGECRAAVALVDAAPAAPVAHAVIEVGWEDVDRRVRLSGALLRSVQIAGALESALDLAARYAAERIQFGQPIARFQAVQHLLAAMVGEKVAVAAAVGLALRNVTVDGLDAETSVAAIAAAKVRAGEAADLAARAAHQVHGAIGATREHGLHRTTQALWSWRDEYGDATAWAAELARVALPHAGDLWAWLTTLDDTTAGV